MAHATSGRPAERCRSPQGHHSRAQHQARSRRSAVNFPKTRAREAALRDRVLEAHEVRPLLRAARSGARADAALDRGSRGEPGRQAPRGAADAEGAVREAGSSALACRTSPRGDRAREPLRVPGLRRQAASLRRGHRRDARVRAESLQGHPARAPEALLRELPEDRAALGAESSD
jgi:hypothetical protein